MTRAAAPRSAPPCVSIVVPVRNESGNIGPLVGEIAAALEGRWGFEVICVDDGSIDDTGAELAALQKHLPWLRQIRHAVPCGQSAAVRTGVAAARASIVATLDGDGQNDPRFLPALIAAIAAGSPRIGLVAGQRVDRQAPAFTRLQSRIANGARRLLLRDGARDSACGLKSFRREVFLALPAFDGLHRFLPALFRREGFAVEFVDVVDRGRLHGTSHYGTLDRLLAGLLDLPGVWWLIRRGKCIPARSEVPREDV